jgi:hypothetical protein
VRAAVRETDGKKFIEMHVSLLRGDQPMDDDREIFLMRARRLDGSDRIELRVKSDIRATDKTGSGFRKIGFHGRFFAYGASASEFCQPL